MLPVNTKVIVNTGGEDSNGLIINYFFDKGGLKSLRAHYWEEQDAYLIQFDNKTQQYIPAKYIKEITGKVQ